jgi:hypothetical protein
MKPEMKMEAIHLRANRWVVRPFGQLGTCGWRPTAWRAKVVTARSETEALIKAEAMR